MQSILHNY